MDLLQNLSQKQSKCPWQFCETVQNAHILRVCSAFLPFHAPDSRDFAKLNLLLLNPNLIFEIGSNKVIKGMRPLISAQV